MSATDKIKKKAEPTAPKPEHACRRPIMERVDGINFKCKKCGFIEKGCRHQGKLEKITDYAMLCHVCGGIVPDMEKVFDNLMAQSLADIQAEQEAQVCAHAYGPFMPAVLLCHKCGSYIPCSHEHIVANCEMCFCEDCQTYISPVH